MAYKGYKLIYDLKNNLGSLEMLYDKVKPFDS